MERGARFKWNKERKKYKQQQQYEIQAVQFVINDLNILR